MRINQYTVAIIAFITLLVLTALIKISDERPELFPVALFLFLIIVVAWVLALPNFYRKRLENRAPRNLRRFIMSDPELRQAVKPEAQPEPTPTSHENPPPTEPEKKT